MSVILGIISFIVGLWMLYTGFMLAPVWVQWLIGSSIACTVSGFFFALARD